MIEYSITAILVIGIILFFLKKRVAAYACGAIGFTWLAFFQLSQNMPIGLIALIFTVGCIERLIAINRTKKILAKK